MSFRRRLEVVARNGAVAIASVWAAYGEPAFGDAPFQIKDIMTVIGQGSVPDDLVLSGAKLFFSADDGVHGRELWKSDGTALGTVMVADVFPGSGSARPRDLAALGGMVFFGADDGLTGSELWKSDGTAAGTVRVADIFPGAGSSFPTDLTVSGGTLFFVASDGIRGGELWKSDGTAAGTTIVADLLLGGLSSSPQELTDMGGTLFFSADDSAFMRELWRTDGTSIVLVKDIFGGDYGGSLAVLGDVKGKLLLRGDDGLAGREPWQSDGTDAGTLLLADLFLGSAGSEPQDLTMTGDRVFFTAFEPATGRELWAIEPICPATVDLSGKRVIADYVFEAAQAVTGGDLTFSNGAQVEIVAGQSASFRDGFSVGGGSNLTVSVGTLPAYCQ